MKKKLFLYTALTVAVIFMGVLLYSALYGDAKADSSPKVDSVPLDIKVAIRGTIMESSHTGEVGNILVEADDPSKYEFDKASVYITKDTLIYRNGEKITYEIGLLEIDMVVEVEITGPIRESYPVQVDAKIVSIVSE
ncbi:MAG TPA: hypothetical protein VLN47_08880 [Clostridiaceae bacterium]|nr:hypothetical protein [Clostridiaceae bacterium]